MNQTSQNSEIQVRLPRSGELCTFPLDSDTRFSDVFRALISKGCFACPQEKHPVWVPLCGDQDLVTWFSEENTFYDRFPFGEPPIASVPSWVTKEVHFSSYPDPLARAKAIYLYFEGPSPLWDMRDFCGSTKAIRSHRSRRLSGRPSAAVPEKAENR